MAAGRNVIGILGPAAAVGLGFFVPTVFYGVQPTPDTTTQLRTPYLSPPFKFRNNQIDQSRPLNLPATTQPFGPFDWSKPFFPVVRVDNHQPTNIKLLTNPIPVGPYDYSNGPEPVRRFAPDQTYPNIALTSTPVVAPVVTPDYSNGPENVRRFAPDQTYPNLVLLAAYVAGSQFEPRTPVLTPPKQPRNNQIDASQPLNIALTTVTVQMPFGPFDWSKPVSIKATPQLAAPPYNANLYTNPIPFGPYDYNISHDVISSPPQALPYNINIFTNPVPFGPYDWTARAPQMPSRAPDQIERNPNLFSEVPFVPVDYNIAHRVVSSPPQPQPYNINIFVNLIPFGPYDYNKPKTVITSPPQALPYNPNIFTNPIPFGPYDWTARPPQMPARAPDQIERNPLIFSEVPIVPIDWSARPQQLPPRAPDQIYYNIPLNVTVVQAPFAQYDWSKPFFPPPARDTTQPTNINLYQNPIPFGPYDLSYRPSQFPPRAPDQLYYNIVLNVTAAQAPIIPFDWNRPFFPRTLKENAPQTNVNLFTNPIPFGPYDWSFRPNQYPPRAPDVFHRNPLIFSEVPLIPVDLSRPVTVRAPPLVAQPYNIAIYQAPPPRSIDFSATRQLPGLPPPPQPYAINLLAPSAAPFLNIDWSKPFAIRPVPPQALANLTIRLPPPPPAPIIPFDWNRPYAVRLSPPQPQPNLTLFLPPPAIIGIPALCFSKDVPVNVSRAYDTTTQQAKAVDFRLYKASAVDQGTATANAKDVMLFTAKANTTPAGQDWSGAGYMAQYEIDTAIELQGVFINALTGVYIDPTAITLLVLDPSGAQTTYTWPSATIVRDSVGHFHQVITPSKSGLWTYKWQGTGAAVATSPDTTFTINSSALIPG